MVAPARTRAPGVPPLAVVVEVLVASVAQEPRPTAATVAQGYRTRLQAQRSPTQVVVVVAVAMVQPVLAVRVAVALAAATLMLEDLRGP